MGKRFGRAGIFMAGAMSVVLIVVLLMAFGVVPVKTETTTLVHTGGQATTVATTASSGEQLTPQQIYQKYSSGVVEVLATFGQQGDAGPFAQPSSGQALGTGFVVSEDGYILTNAHVVAQSGRRADSVVVGFKSDQNDETTKVDATVVGVDETSDVALLKVDPAEAPALNPLPLGDSSKVAVGEPVVAIGNPLGYDFSVTSGIVSAVDRELQSPNGSVIPNGIQTDAAINSGNSGGPLIDATGHVIGINEQIASKTGGSDGLGFAVPIDTAVAVMKQLQDSGKVAYAYLGIEGQTVSADVASALGLKADAGVLVASVAPGSPAQKAGLRGGDSQQVLQDQQFVVGGDLITAFDGKPLTSVEGLIAQINQRKPGDRVTLSVVRGGATSTIAVTLGERPTTIG